jgi:hypothetical protein
MMPPRSLACLAAAALVLSAPSACWGYIHFSPMTLKKMCKDSHHIRLLRLDKANKDKGVMLFETAAVLKGERSSITSFKHVIPSGVEAAQPIRDWIGEGKTALIFYIEGGGGGLGYVFIDRYCYSVDYNQHHKHWLALRGEPGMSACYYGPVDLLHRAVRDTLAGKECQVPTQAPAQKIDKDRRDKIINAALAKNRRNNPAPPTDPVAVLGIAGERFTLNGTPTFLLGFSYYGALGASEKTIRADLDQMQALGFNWIRVWATWSAFDNDVSAVDVHGQPRAVYLDKLAWLVGECARRGMVVDVTLSRGNGVSGPKRLQSLEAHERAVTSLIDKLKPLRNWYLDLGNERNIKDERFVSFAELKTLRALVKKLDPDRLVTASAAGDIPREEVKAYLLDVGVDFLAPHRPRHAKSPGQTEEKTRLYRAGIKDLERTAPVHYQEPFRRGFGGYDPTAEDFWTDLQAARKSGAAGWCFHNGDQRARPDGRPRRSFDMRDQGVFAQLDEVERAFLKRLGERGPD